MRPGDTWEVSVGRFSMSGTDDGDVRLSGPRSKLTYADIEDLLRLVHEAAWYAVQYDPLEKRDAAS